jgi:hypothetical protein
MEFFLNEGRSYAYIEQGKNMILKYGLEMDYDNKADDHQIILTGCKLLCLELGKVRKYVKGPFSSGMEPNSILRLQLQRGPETENYTFIADNGSKQESYLKDLWKQLKMYEDF